MKNKQVEENPSSINKTRQTDYKRFITSTNVTNDDEIADKVVHSIDRQLKKRKYMMGFMLSVPTYTRNDFTDALHEAFGFRTDYEIISENKMKKIFRTTKK